MRASRPFRSFLFALAFLALAEGVLRWIGFDSAMPAQDVLFDAGDPLAGIVLPDADLLFRVRPDADIELLATPIRTDSRGWRTDAAGIDSGAARLRVLCLGGGDVFGRFTGFPSQLARILGPEAVALNAGQPGFSSLQTLALLRRDGLSAKPDVVIWSLTEVRRCDTEVPADGLSDARRMSDGFLAILTRSSHVARLGSWLSARIFRGASVIPRVDAGDARSALAAAAELCAAAGAKLILVRTPSPDLAGTRAIDTSREPLPPGSPVSIETLDLAAAFAEYPAADLWFRAPAADRATPSTLGHRVAAEAVAARLRELGLAAPAPGASPRAARSSRMSAAAIDLDRDGRDEIVVAANVLGRVEAAVVEPANGSVHRLEIPESDAVDDSAAASLSLTYLQAPPAAPAEVAGEGEGSRGVLVAWLTAGGLVETRWLDSRGAVRETGIAPFAGPAGCRSISVDVLERLDGAAPGHLVCFGAEASGAPPVIRVLSESFEPLAVLDVPGALQDSIIGITTGSVLAPYSSNRKQALVAFASAGGPRVACLDGSRRLTELLAPALDDPSSVVAAVTGAFHSDSDVDGVAVLRASFLAICTEGKGYSEPVFPFGATRCDPSLSPPAVVRTGAGSSASLVIGWRTRSSILLVRLAPEGVGKLVAIPIQG